MYICIYTCVYIYIYIHHISEAWTAMYAGWHPPTDPYPLIAYPCMVYTWALKGLPYHDCRADVPRGSKYPIFVVSGSKNHTHTVVFDQRPEILVAWTRWGIYQKATWSPWAGCTAEQVQARKASSAGALGPYLEAHATYYILSIGPPETMISGIPLI